MNWLTELVNQHKELESPTSFWFWAGLCTISAIMKDQVYLDRGGAYKLYPNIYVMLHADSGLKKGPPVGLAKALVKRVNNTRIISGRSSIQGILKELGTAQTIPGGKINAKSVGFIVASEFSSSLVSDPAAMTILTDLYDRQYNEGEWRSLLKMDTFSLKDPTISMLVATNEAHFEDFIASKDMKGGFIGRMFVIAESEVPHLNPLWKKMSVIPDRDKLAEYLKIISKLEGEFIWGEGAGELYDPWYRDFYTQVKKNDVKDPTGTIQRFGDSVLKVAMLLSLADSPELILTRDNVQEAINVCEKLIGSVRKTTHGKKGMAVDAAPKALIINELLNRDNHQISRAMLLKKYWMNFNASQLDDLMAQFDQAGLILTATIGHEVVFKMPDPVVKEYKKFLSGKIREEKK